MANSDLVSWFKVNILFFKIIAIWPGEAPTAYKMAYMAVTLGYNLILFNLLFTIHLISYGSFNMELLIGDGVIYFNQVVVFTKSLTLLLLRHKIFEMFKIINSDTFQPKVIAERKTLERVRRIYNYIFGFNYFISAMAGALATLWPLVSHFRDSIEIAAPVCAFNFLPVEIMSRYFYSIYFVQTLGLFWLLSVNVSVDGLLCGFLATAVIQLQFLNKRLRDFKPLVSNEQDALDLFKQYCMHYQEIERFVKLINEVFTIMLFVQFNMTSFTICVALLGFMLPGITNFNSPALGLYLIAMVSEIFLPCWLGTQLGHESEALGHAAYCSEWITHGLRYRKNLRLFIERAHQPLAVFGWKMFPLTLMTFTAIMKTAYSFCTVLQNMRDS